MSKDRKYNGQKKKDKRTNNNDQTLHRKLKIEQHERHQKPRVSSGLHNNTKRITEVGTNSNCFKMTQITAFLLSVLFISGYKLLDICKIL
jgi:hypothetical protein